MRASLACKGFESVGHHLTQMLQRAEPASSISKYARSVLQRVHKRRSNEKILVTLIEGPSFPGSYLARVNAEVGGASLRIVEPFVNGIGKMVLNPPKLKLGSVVNWLLDLFTKSGVEALQKFLDVVEPVDGTELVH